MLLLTLLNSQQAFSLSVFHLFQGMSRLITVISNVHISSLSVCHTLCWLPLNDHCCCRPADCKDCYDVPAQLCLFWPGLLCSALLFCLRVFFILLLLLLLFDNNQRWGRCRRWRSDVACHTCNIFANMSVHRGYVLSGHTPTHTQTHIFHALMPRRLNLTLNSASVTSQPHPPSTSGGIASSSTASAASATASCLRDLAFRCQL